MSTDKFPHRVGWIGTGRMGAAIATRLLNAGVDLWVWNRTRSKAEALEEKGAKVVDTPAELAERDIVFTMVGGPQDVLDVTFGENGVMSNPDSHPSILIDSTTIDPSAASMNRWRIRGAPSSKPMPMTSTAASSTTLVRKGLRYSSVDR